jgi:hypothetical protein
MTLLELKKALRAGPYAWPGGYPLFVISHDGSPLCFDCVRAEWHQVVWDYLNNVSTGWRCDAIDTNWEDPDLRCDNCGKRIESAYAEPEEASQ